jgi:hypothetical protein
MEITITVRQPTPDFQEKFLAFLGDYAESVSYVPDMRWTPERARAYYDRLPPRARQILLAVVRNGGRVPADQVRVNGGSLRGATGAFRRVLREGALATPPLWPAELAVPVQPLHVGGVLVCFDLAGAHGPEDPRRAFEAALVRVVHHH